MRVLDLCDDKKLRERYRHKCQNAKRNDIECDLTFEQYCDLMRAAGIKSSQLGIKGYHLARYGDKGAYTLGNCRFIPYLENMAERKPADSVTISKGLKRYYRTHDGSFLGLKHSDKTKSAIGLANKVAQAGKRNSQYGRCWVTSKGRDKKIDRDELRSHLAAGWRRGRASSSKFAPVV